MGKILGDVEKILKKTLLKAIKKNNCEGLLFSGGLDSSIIASLSPSVIGITVSLGPTSEDSALSASLANHLKVKHFQKKVDIDKAIDTIPAVIKIVQSFDPALPNDLAIYFGLKEAKRLGLKKVATGDGSDELFAGYSFMQDMDDVEKYIHMLSEKMSFSSIVIGQFFQISIVQPFCDKSLIDFALQIPINLKIKKTNGRIWGKWILRKTYENQLPEKSIWQSKRPIEIGSGMSRLRQIISDRVSDEEFNNNPFPIKFFNKEHFYYYKIYRKVGGEIPKPQADEDSCPGCGAGIKKDHFHCRICGYVLDWRERTHADT